MKTDVYLFYRFDYQPLNFFKIKNTALRNKYIINYMGYNVGTFWTNFVQSFINSYTPIILNSNVSIDQNFEGFILMYFDTVLNKKVILTDIDNILEALSTE